MPDGFFFPSTIYTPTDQYRVILEADEDFKRESADLSRLYVRSAGRLVPLSAVAQFKSQVGPLTVQHLGQLPAVTLSLDLAKGTSLSDLVPVIERTAKAELGEQVSTQFPGTAQAFKSSLGNLGMLLLMAVLVIYIILGILSESFIHPLTILSGLPSAGFGALWNALILHARWGGFILARGFQEKAVTTLPRTARTAAGCRGRSGRAGRRFREHRWRPVRRGLEGRRRREPVRGGAHDRDVLSRFVSLGRAYRDADRQAMAQPAWATPAVTTDWTSLPGALLASANAPVTKDEGRRKK
jgi:hypothetical protein